MTAQLPIAAVRQQARNSRCHVADLLADGELDQVIETIIISLVQIGWVLLPPSFGVVSMATAAEVERLDRNRGCDRL